MQAELARLTDLNLLVTSTHLTEKFRKEYIAEIQLLWNDLTGARCNRKDLVSFPTINLAVKQPQRAK